MEDKHMVTSTNRTRESALADWNSRKRAEDKSGTVVVGIIGLVAMIAGALLLYYLTAGLFRP